MKRSERRPAGDSFSPAATALQAGLPGPVAAAAQAALARAIALKNARRYGEAAGEARQLLALDPNMPQCHDILALSFWAAGRHEDAERSARRAVALAPNFADAYVTLATVLTTVGRFAEATAALESALAAQPDHASAIFDLVSVSKSHATPAMAARVEKMLRGERRPDRKAMLHFALGKIYDDMADYARAFEHYRAGNECAAPAVAFRPDRFEAHIDRTISIYTRDFFGAHANFGSESRRPIFIFGMPRSGTSLVEQVLAAHPGVAAGGELPFVLNLVASLPQHIGTDAQNPECVLELSESGARSLADDYLAALDRLSRDASRVTDKYPFAYYDLGLIALLFPQAAFIHCRRDPMDTCLSCYFSRFDRALDFTSRLESLGAYYRGYRRLMDHWHRAIPAPMLEVDYEDLVENQEAVTRRILAHCGLAWDDRCLAFQSGAHPVLTASAWQVRQPLYKSAVGRWRNYEQFLGPLKAALGGSGS